MIRFVLSVLLIALFCYPSSAEPGEENGGSTAEWEWGAGGYEDPPPPPIEYKQHTIYADSDTTIKLKVAQIEASNYFMNPGEHEVYVTIDRKDHETIIIPHDNRSQDFAPDVLMHQGDIFILTCRRGLPIEDGDDDDVVVTLETLAVVNIISEDAEEPAVVFSESFDPVYMRQDDIEFCRYEFQLDLKGDLHLLLMCYTANLEDTRITPDSVQCLRSFVYRNSKWIEVANNTASPEPKELETVPEP